MSLDVGAVHDHAGYVHHGQCDLGRNGSHNALRLLSVSACQFQAKNRLV
jgi:hypothetical protein